MKIKRPIAAYVLYVICTLISNCTHIPVDPCAYTDVSYSNDIAPLITTYCSNASGCHIPGSTIGNLSNFDTLKMKINDGDLYAMVFTYQLMPPDTVLPDKELSLLQCWLEKGALQN